MSGNGSMEHDYTDTSPLLTIPKNGNSNKVASGIDQKQDSKRKDNIPSLSLFHCVNPLDIIILLFATLLRVISGFAIPCTLLVVSLTFDEFIYYQIAENEEYFCNQSIKTLEKYITASAPDNVLENEVTHRMYYLFGIATIRLFSLITSHTLWSYSTLKITDRFRVSFLQSILSKDVTWYDLKPLAELPTYLTDNMQIIESGIGHDMTELIENLSTVILSYILAMIVNWKLSLAMCPIVVMTLIAIAVIVKVASTQGYKRQSALSKAGSIAEEMLSSIRTVVAFGGQKKGIERYQINLTKAKHESYKLHLAVSIASMISAFCSFSFIVVGLGYGSLLSSNCDITLGEILTVILLFVYANVAVYFGVSSFAGIGGAFGSYKNISTFLHQEPQLDANLSLGTIPNSIEGSILFSSVIFSYPSRPDVKVLKGLELSIKSGQTVALVGPSGCGKSTIIKLLMRIYDCNGLISVDGIDVKQLDVHWLRNQIGIVSQEPFLFNVSIAENIMYGKERATNEEIEKASIAANAHDFISELPEGYNTLVGDGGIQLSGGEKQRVAIARALVRNPKILLLDEATSALDTKSEKIVQEALDKARVGCTTIIIAHRLSTIKNSDVIVSMDKGRIIEIGNHNELMDNKGLYYQLVTSQTIEDENDKISAANFIEEDVPLITPKIELNMRENKIKQPYSSSTYINLDQEQAEINEHNSASIMEIFKLNKNNWCLTLTGLICVVTIAILVAAVLAIMSSALYQLGETDSDDVIQGIIPFVVSFLLIALSFAVLSFLGIFTLLVGGERFTEVLRLKMFSAMLRQEMAWFDRPENTAGILTTKLSVNPTQVNKAIGYPFARMIEGFVGLLTGTVILFVSSWVLGLILFPVYILAVLGQVLQVFLTQKSLVKINALTAKSSKVAVEAIGAIQTVTSLEIKHIIERLYQQKLRKSFKYKVMSRIIHVAISTMYFSAHVYCYGVAIRVAVILYLSDESKVYHIDEYKNVISAILVASMLPYLYKTSFLAVRDYQDAVLSIGQINALLQRNPIIDSQSTDGQELDECHGELTLKQVHFTYPSRPEVPVLQDINIHIKSGQTLAIVGPSGSGKSTVISLTERFYDPTAGGLLLDGIDLRDFNISWLRHQISLVSQEPALFNTSIADNIRYGASFQEISDKEVVDAAITANIHDFIQSLPQGYETIVGLKGSQLSGGQKQRIAIARALVQDPKILLLDEATSALDTETEKIVQDALNKAREGRTTIIVAHRLSTIYNSDKIVVIQKGHVIEEGTHSELMYKEGTYYLMNKVQGL